MDNIIYFPWDIDSDNAITPSDGIFVINRLGETSPLGDSIDSVNRIGYLINDSVFELV